MHCSTAIISAFASNFGTTAGAIAPDKPSLTEPKARTGPTRIGATNLEKQSASDADCAVVNSEETTASNAT